MDSSPTSMFNAYSQDFQHIISSINEKLQSAPQLGEQGKATLRKVEVQLDEADELVSQMQIELEGIPKSMRASYQARLKSVQRDLARSKKQHKELDSQLSRTALLGRTGQHVFSSDESTSDRTRLLAGTEMLSDGTRRLQETHRIALEAEEQGADVLRNLRGQREQIENAQNTLMTADTSINRASSTLNKMIRTMYKQRIIMYSMVVVLILVVLLILWFKLRR